MSCLLAVALAPAIALAQNQAPAAQEIVVSAEKLNVETRIDRKIYNVGADLQSDFGTVTDILNNIPSVEVDAEGAVALRGDTHVLILIDGHPSAQLSGPNAGDNLQQIPAADIERIEVFTNPPPQFKAEGAAGVINIVMRKKRAAGLSGSTLASLGNDGRYVVGANAADNTGPLTVSGGASLRQDYRRRLLRSDLTAADPTTGELATSHNTIDEVIHRENPLFKLALDYAPDEVQVWQLSANRSARTGNRYYTQPGSTSDATGLVTAESERHSAGHDWSLSSDQQLAYTRKLGQPAEELNVTLHRTLYYEREHYDYTVNQAVPEAPTTYSNLSLNEDSVTDELAIDYVLPFSKTRLLKLGYDFEEDDFRYGNFGNTVDPATGTQIPNPDITNEFKVVQRIHSVYSSYQDRLGEWAWLAGLRGEQTLIDTRQLTAGIDDQRHYFRVYPSLHLDRSLSDTATLSIAASRRVTRPDPGDLNPYVDHEYTPNLRAGNPDLQPQDTRALEVGYAVEKKSLTYGITGYFRRNLDSVTDLTEYLGNGFSLSTKVNLPRNDSTGLELTGNGRLTATLSYNVSANLFHSQIDASALGGTGLLSTTGVNAKLKFDLRPTDRDSVQLSATRSDKRLTPQGYVSAINLVNLGYKHQFPGDLAAVATVSDVFNGQNYRRFVATPTLTEQYQRSVAGRIAYVGIVYAFGAGKKPKAANFDYDQ